MHFTDLTEIHHEYHCIYLQVLYKFITYEHHSISTQRGAGEGHTSHLNLSSGSEGAMRWALDVAKPPASPLMLVDATLLGESPPPPLDAGSITWYARNPRLHPGNPRRSR